MSILAWAVLGLIAGFIASKLVGRPRGAVILDLLLGLIGAFAAGFLFTRFAHAAPSPTAVSAPSILAATLGAVSVLFVYHAVAARRAR